MAKRKTDEAFVEHLKRDVPEALEADVDFDTAVMHVLHAGPDRVAIRRRKRKRRISGLRRSKPKRTQTPKR